MGAISGARWAWLLGPATVAGLLAAWLWPIGLGGSMPVGGDVTQFQIGLMAVLGEALRDGRLPLWNDRWGFGFPGLAESQMGVYYPPHALLYGLFSVEAAYTASMVLHVVWGGLGARWAARRFGASEAGAVLAGWAWGASGFFLIHLPHQWAYTVGSWCPWAFGLAWSILDGRPASGRRAPWLLAAVLAVQILPGHFQLAFGTQVGLLAMAAGALLFAGGGRRATAGRAVAVVLAVAAGFLLASAQVVPTAQLARLAGSQRDFEYLSGFAATPLHLVNLVAPDLFHRSPLWRPVVWDPFHTSPEELRLYVGLVPLFLAIGAIARPGPSGARAGRVLVVVLLAGLTLALGPYVPAFETYCRWPGFSFFRAPARWGMLVSLALAILAGLGLDAIRDGRWRRPGIAMVGFAIGAVAWVAVVLGGFEGLLRASEGPARAEVARAGEVAFALRPWDDGLTLEGVLLQARGLQDDLRVQAAQVREGLGTPGVALRLTTERGRIYRAELGTTAALLVALTAVGLSPLGRRRGALAIALFVLAVVDLGLLARRRPVDTAPIRPLAEQSAVLGRLAAMPTGTRSIDPMGNLAMVAGANPVQSYRTLDLPILRQPIGLAESLPFRGWTADQALDLQRALGIRARVNGPHFFGARAIADQFAEAGRAGSSEVVADPELTAWLLGRAFARTPAGRDSRYLIVDAGPAPRGWLLPTASGDDLARLQALKGEHPAVLDTIAAARPLEVRSPTPEHLTIPVEAEAGGVVVVSQLDYPEWRASVAGPDGRANPAPVVRVFDGWQAIPLPGPGRWTLRLDYEGRAERLGLILSAIAWAGWLLGFGWASRGPAAGRSGGEQRARGGDQSAEGREQGENIESN